MSDYSKYKLMLKAGLPEKGAVRQKLVMDGLDPDDFFNSQEGFPVVGFDDEVELAREPPPLPPRTAKESLQNEVGGSKAELGMPPPKFGMNFSNVESIEWNYDEEVQRNYPGKPPAFSSHQGAKKASKPKKGLPQAPTHPVGSASRRPPLPPRGVRAKNMEMRDFNAALGSSERSQGRVQTQNLRKPPPPNIRKRQQRKPGLEHYNAPGKNFPRSTSKNKFANSRRQERAGHIGSSRQPQNRGSNHGPGFHTNHIVKSEFQPKKNRPLSGMQNVSVQSRKASFSGNKSSSQVVNEFKPIKRKGKTQVETGSKDAELARLRAENEKLRLQLDRKGGSASSSMQKQASMFQKGGNTTSKTNAWDGGVANEIQQLKQNSFARKKENIHSRLNNQGAGTSTQSANKTSYTGRKYPIPGEQSTTGISSAFSGQLAQHNRNNDNGSYSAEDASYSTNQYGFDSNLANEAYSEGHEQSMFNGKDGEISPLPEGWIEQFSDEYQTAYFVNTYTGESTWVRPV